jgi:SRSO17 transposase
VFVSNTEDGAVAAAHSVDPDRWWTGFGEVRDRIAARFTRHEPRRRAASLMLGLMADLGRKNCWSIAEHRGDRTPHGLQHLLSRAVWDADGVRDDLRGYVTDHLGHQDAVLVVDETGDLKRGDQTVGVQRQYTGTAGRVENAQVAVYLAYAAPAGHTLIDRALYLPQGWVDDPDRCTTAGIPADVGFATKPALATDMITAALDAGIPASWVAGDEVYGADPTLRNALERREVGYVCWPSPATGASRSARAGGGSTPDRRPAALVLAATVRRDRRTRPADVLLGVHDDPNPVRSSVGSWCAATSPPTSWPTT